MVRPPVALLLAAGLALPAPLPAAPGDREGKSGPAPESAGAPEDRITPEHQKAIDRGLEWLGKRQNTDGSFEAGAGVQGQTAVTSLATLAFLGAGHGLRHGPWRGTVRRAVRWLLDAQANSSFKGYVSFRGDDLSKMHGHGFATLALAEAYGTAASPDEKETRDPEEQELRSLSRDLRKGIQAAVDCIESSQAIQGGWYYAPSATGSGDHEGSVTVCQVQALLAASNRGFVVSLGRIKKAREYMKRSQASSGGFKYQLSTIETPGSRGNETFALTAAGITSLVGLAEYDRREALDRAFAYLDRLRPPPLSGQTGYPFYGAFYGVQAYHWKGGDRWRNYWLPLRSRILQDQKESGAWEGQDTPASIGDVYPTAFCLLMLEVPVGYLSIYAK